MDPALLKEREAFKKRAMAMPSIEKRKIKAKDDSSTQPRKKMKKELQRPAAKPAAKPAEFNYKTMSGGTQTKFAVLAKIVKRMKERHADGSIEPLTVEEMLDETNQLDCTQRQKHWLITEALPSNPKIDCVEGDKYKFKPKFNIKDKKALLRLLDKNDQRGLGGILKDDVEESLPRAPKALRLLGDDILYITRPDKKQVLFYNDKSIDFKVEEDLQKIWRSVTVEGVDERKIEEYLQRQGITSMQDIEVKRATQKKRKTGKRKKATTKDNTHMDGILQDFSEVVK